MDDKTISTDSTRSPVLINIGVVLLAAATTLDTRSGYIRVLDRTERVQHDNSKAKNISGRQIPLAPDRLGGKIVRCANQVAPSAIGGLIQVK